MIYARVFEKNLLIILGGGCPRTQNQARIKVFISTLVFLEYFLCRCYTRCYFELSIARSFSTQGRKGKLFEFSDRLGGGNDWRLVIGG